MIRAVLAQNGSDNHGIITFKCDSKSRLMAPNVGLNSAEKIKMDTKAGTAHGSISTVRIVRLNLIRLSLTKSAKNKPSTICKVVARNVQTIVHVNTLKNVSFQMPIVNKSVKFLKPTQFNKFRGGALYWL